VTPISLRHEIEVGACAGARAASREAAPGLQMGPGEAVVKIGIVGRAIGEVAASQFFPFPFLFGEGIKNSRSHCKGIRILKRR